MKKNIFALAFIGSVLLAVALLLHARFRDTYNVQISEITLNTTKLPPTSPGLTVVHLSDLHIETFGTFEAQVADKVNTLNPDIIVITGDFFKHSEYHELSLLDKMRAEMAQIILFLKSLRARHGIYVSRGNADFSNDSEISNYFPEELEKNGIHVLANQGRIISINNDSYYVAGIDFAGFEKADVADFQIRGSETNQYIQSFPSRKNSYAHFFAIDNTAQWQNYTYSGRLRVNETEQNAIGVTFYSQFHRGYDSYYRLRQAGTGGAFYFSAHDAAVTGDSLDSGITITAKKWLRFKIQCVTHPARTEMRAKLWNDGEPEPLGWSAAAIDTSTGRIVGGAVGLWSGGSSKHQFDDLLVVNDNGDTLVNENFEQAPMQQSPPDWVAYNYGYQAIPVLMKNAAPELFSIMLAHTPDFAFYAQPCKVDLVLSGHTHGGQIRLPFIGPLYSNIKSPRKYIQGLHNLDGTTLYVNRGIGAAWPTLRLFCPPEITCIRILPE
ncbi:MAG TPA: metallophosphoesterase [bacterium]|nr:metallophosphoesterase [bacterium]HPN44655.1 metallophosphoesterase [bacterium]